MPDLYKRCVCPLCSQRYELEDNITVDAIFYCEACHAKLQMIATEDGHYLLYLIAADHSGENTLRKCEFCAYRNRRYTLTLSDSLCICHELYRCEMDIREKFSYGQIPRYRCFCNKEEGIFMDKNIEQTTDLTEIEHYELQVVSKSLEQTETILDMFIGYAYTIGVSLNITESAVTQFTSYYAHHTATISIKISEGRLNIEVQDSLYDWKHCINYYQFCREWEKLVSNFNILLDVNTDSEVSRFTKHLRNPKYGISPSDVKHLFDIQN